MLTPAELRGRQSRRENKKGRGRGVNEEDTLTEDVVASLHQMSAGVQGAADLALCLQPAAGTSTSCRRVKVKLASGGGAGVGGATDVPGQFGWRELRGATAEG